MRPPCHHAEPGGLGGLAGRGSRGPPSGLWVCPHPQFIKNLHSALRTLHRGPLAVAPASARCGTLSNELDSPRRQPGE